MEGRDELVEMTVEGVQVSVQEQGHPCAVQLVSGDGARRLSVFVGVPEATAISFALQGLTTPRPMTHDALKQVVDALGGRLDRVVVGFRPEASTYTADVVVAVDGGDERHLDWRVSDAVAVAVRCDPRPTILVPSRLLDAPPPP